MDRRIYLPTRLIRLAWPSAGVLLDHPEGLRDLPAGWLCLGPPRLLAFVIADVGHAAAYAPAPTRLAPLFAPTGEPRVELRWPELGGGLWASDGDPAELFELLTYAGPPAWMLLASGEGAVIQAVARQATLPKHALTRLLIPVDRDEIDRYQF